MDRTQRKLTSGRVSETPVVGDNVLFVVVGAFVGLLVLALLLVYYFA